MAGGHDSPKQQFVKNPKFSPNLQEELYGQQSGAPTPSNQYNQQQYNPQQQYSQQQYNPQQYNQQQQYISKPPPSEPIYQQYASKPSPPSDSIYQQNTNEIYYNDISQQQYSPQSQQYVDNSNFIYSQPPTQQTQQQQQPGFGPYFSPAVTGNYQHLKQPPSDGPPIIHRRPPASLYAAHPSNQYYGGRPVYQSQQNFHLRPPNGNGYENENGGFMESISNFITNIGQGAADLFANRAPVNQYQPPVPINSITPHRPGYNQPPSSPSFGGAPANPVNQFSKAIEEITRNDDFQCIPKVICQMVGSQRRQPSILGSPIFSA